MFQKKEYQLSPISLTLELWIDSNAFDFVNTVAFFCYNACSFNLITICQDKHFSTFQIAINHGLLLIGQEQ